MSGDLASNIDIQQIDCDVRIKLTDVDALASAGVYHAVEEKLPGREIDLSDDPLSDHIDVLNTEVSELGSYPQERLARIALEYRAEIGATT